jgi:hypothetical protein
MAKTIRELLEMSQEERESWITGVRLDESRKFHSVESARKVLVSWAKEILNLNWNLTHTGKSFPGDDDDLSDGLSNILNCANDILKHFPDLMGDPKAKIDYDPNKEYSDRLDKDIKDKGLSR